MRRESEAMVRYIPARVLPARGFAAGTAVMTLDGALPVEFLTPGDRVLTRNGARVLRRIDVSVATDTIAIRIGAETLGIDTPADDLLVAPCQPVVVRDWRARAMCGAASGVVAADALCDGEFIREERVAELRLFTLCFDAAEVIYAGGLELACPALTVVA